MCVKTSYFFLIILFMIAGGSSRGLAEVIVLRKSSSHSRPAVRERLPTRILQIYRDQFSISTAIRVGCEITVVLCLCLDTTQNVLVFMHEKTCLCDIKLCKGNSEWVSERERTLIFLLKFLSFLFFMYLWIFSFLCSTESFPTLKVWSPMFGISAAKEVEFPAPPINCWDSFPSAFFSKIK